MDKIVPMALILARASGCLAHMDPVGGLVAGAPESVLLHEGLQQMQAMALAMLPVGIDPPGNVSKNMARQMRNPNPR